MGGGFTRGAMGVFSLFVSCEEAELEGSMGDDGSGDMKFSVDSDSVWVGGGMEDGIMVGAGGGRFGIGNSWRATLSIRETICGNRAGQTEKSIGPPFATVRKMSSSSISIILGRYKSCVDNLFVVSRLSL